MRYPNVLSEDLTLTYVLTGSSICRYGDGELKIVRGASTKSQPYNPALSHILKKALLYPGKCVTCIPNVNSDTPKIGFWERYAEEQYTRFYDQKLTYGSSFITRPDSAPWIERADYWDKVRSIWTNKDVTLVRGSTRSLTEEQLGPMTKSFQLVLTTPQNAFLEYDRLKALCIKAMENGRLVLLCCGATATALAWELAQLEIGVILDVGHVGMFLRRWDSGDLKHQPQLA